MAEILNRWTRRTDNPFLGLPQDQLENIKRELQARLALAAGQKTSPQQGILGGLKRGLSTAADLFLQMGGLRMPEVQQEENLNDLITKAVLRKQLEEQLKTPEEKQREELYNQYLQTRINALQQAEEEPYGLKQIPVPEGYEIVGYYADGTPRIAKKKEPKPFKISATDLKQLSKSVSKTIPWSLGDIIPWVESPREKAIRQIREQYYRQFVPGQATQVDLGKISVQRFSPEKEDLIRRYMQKYPDRTREEIIRAMQKQGLL
ncbi:MAG: hypothetical protein DRP74_08505 [Candidatus Omnitrophota bacterium]|nr:MAG: hypothetical protein DRP74_08505 [Candidatus Omnitrophota bacterium]